MPQSYSVSLDTIVRELGLTVVNRAVDYDRVQITTWEVSRPGLPLAGFYDYFDATRVQIIGKLEITYLMDMRPEARSRSIERFISSGIRFCIIAHGMEIPPEMLMALLSRGHRLVADDAIEVKRTAQDTLVGSSPELIRYFMEIRGIGLIDARHMFGIGAVKPDQVIDLVVHFEPWDENKVYDRLGNETHFTEILGVKIPYFVIPVRPGRNLAAILELAAMNNRERKMGYNAAQVLVERHDRMVDEG